jgi:hypothetical protein
MRQSFGASLCLRRAISWVQLQGAGRWDVLLAIAPSRKPRRQSRPRHMLLPSRSLSPRPLATTIGAASTQRPLPAVRGPSGVHSNPLDPTRHDCPSSPRSRELKPGGAAITGFSSASLPLEAPRLRSRTGQNRTGRRRWWW